MKARPLLAYGGLTLAAILADQWIKGLVERRLVLHEQVDVLPFLALYRTYNTGVAFSMFSGASDGALMLLSLGVAGFVLYLASRTSAVQVFARAGFAMIIGGAIGNLIDRWLYGHVVDYILFHTPGWSFAVFNLADAFISLGAALVILEELLDWRRQRRPG